MKSAVSENRFPDQSASRRLPFRRGGTLWKQSSIKALLLCLLAVQLSCQSGLTQAQEAQESMKKQSDVKSLIPDDPEHRLILWDLSGGFRRPLPDDFEKLPTLQIFADGRVVSGANGPELENGEARLSEEELTDLMEFVVDECEFFETSQAELRELLKDYRSPLADGMTTDLNVETVRDQQSISIYALRMAANAFPESEGLQHLSQLEARLKTLKLLADAGGQDGLKTVLEKVNQQLKVEGSDVTMTPANLVAASRFKDGRLTMRFHQRLEDASTTALVIRQNKEADLEIKITIGQ